MNTSLILLWLVCCAGAMAIYFKRRIEETISISIFFSILIVFVVGTISGSLLYGVYLCVGYGCISAIYVLRSLIKEKSVVREYCLTTGLLIFVILFGAIWYINRARLFSLWDEFTHWGLVVKNMCIFDDIGNNPNATTMLKGYPPATALWQYLICKLYGGFAESRVYQAHGWLCVSLFLPITKNMNKKKGWAFYSVLFLMGLPFVFFTDYLTCIMVDAVLSVMFARILIIGYWFNYRDKFDYIDLGVSCAIICLTKASGLFLALVALGVILICNIICEKRVRWGIAGAALVGILCGKYGWTLYLKLSNTADAWDVSNFNIKNLIRLFSGEGEAYWYTVIKEFLYRLSAVTTHNYVFNMSLLAWIAVIIFAFLMINRIRNEQKLVIYENGLMLGGVIYSVGLLLLYIFTYSQYEAVRLASFVRYLSTYLLGIVIWGVNFLLVYYAENENTKVAKSGGVALLASLLLFLPANEIFDVTFLYNEKVEATYTTRSAYSAVEKCKEVLDPSEDKVYIISQNSTGLSYYTSQYVLTPVHVQDWIYTDEGISLNSWSLGEKYYADDIWTSNYSCEEFLNLLEENGFTHVFLWGIDEAFLNSYKGAFAADSDIVSNSLYEYVISENSRYLQMVR